MSEFERLLLASLTGLAYLLFCLWCHRRHRSKLVQASGCGDILIAYASQTGTALQLARQSAAALNGRARLLPLNRVDAALLHATRQALFVASTSGDGEAPDNGAQFARSLLEGSVETLAHLRFAVLALGDSQYPRFCAFGQGLHEQLARRGAQAISAPLRVDAAQPDAARQTLARWRAHLQRLGGHALPEPPELLATAGDRWALRERFHLNPGSPGEPLFHLRFTARPGCIPHWQPGDIAEITPPGSDTPRHYSIASLPGDGSLDLVVRQQRDSEGRRGLASGWLTGELDIHAELPLHIRENPLFRPPPADTPLILIGNGSGIAGLRALLRWRERHGGGRNWLLFGERDPVSDRPFSEELDAWQTSGLLNQRQLAFSRCPRQPRYVQRLLREQAGSLHAWLKAGAVIMVCGSREGMARGVDQTLADLLGRATVEQLHLEDRYRRDVY